MALAQPMRVEIDLHGVDAIELPRGLKAAFIAPPPGLAPSAASPRAARAASPRAATQNVEAAKPGLAQDGFQNLQLQRQALLMQNVMLQQSMALRQAQAAYFYGNYMRMAPQHAAFCGQPAATTPAHAPAKPLAAAKAQPDGESTVSGQSECDSLDDGLDARTTVVIKKVPKGCTTALLAELLNAQGYKGSFDLLYAPVCFRTMLGTGCAFANFRSTAEAEKFMAEFAGFDAWGLPAGDAKRAEVSWSQACQGWRQHVERYRNSPVLHDSVPDACRPMIFGADGVREAFPAPTRNVKAPSMGRRPS